MQFIIHVDGIQQGDINHRLLYVFHGPGWCSVGIFKHTDSSIVGAAVAKVTAGRTNQQSAGDIADSGAVAIQFDDVTVVHLLTEHKLSRICNCVYCTGQIVICVCYSTLYQHSRKHCAAIIKVGLVIVKCHGLVQVAIGRTHHHSGGFRANKHFSTKICTQCWVRTCYGLSINIGYKSYVSKCSTNHAWQHIQSC